MTADRAPESRDVEELLAHAAWLRGLAAALVRDEASADDLVQDTLLAAMHRPRPRGVAPRAWLTGIARNLARFRARSGARRAERERLAARAETLPDGATLVERLDTQRRLAAAVAELSEPTRSIVLLRFYEGLDSAEIARRRGEPAGTVRWRLKQGIDELRGRLDASHGGDRRRWMAALAPLASPRVAPPPAPRGGGAGWGGIVMASASNVAAAGAAVLLLVAGGLWYGLRADDPDVGAARSARTPDAPAPERTEAAAAAERKRARGRSADSPPDASSAAAQAPAAASPADGARVAGRLVDASGAPLRGGTVRVGFGGKPHRAADDGSFTVDVPAAGEPGRVFLQLWAPGCAVRVLSKRVARGDAADVGDVQLREGGTVTGLVVDDAGLAVPGAWIVCTRVPVEDADAPQKRDGLGTPPAPELLVGPQGSLTTVIEPSPDGPGVVADERGAFVLDGLAVGAPTPLRVGAQGHSQILGSVAARAEGPVGGARLVLPRLRETEGIEGRVVGPDGAPAAGIRFFVEFDGQAIRGVSEALTDAAGNFHLDTTDHTTISLHVHDPVLGWTSERVAGLTPGRRGVVLAARIARTAQIEARGSDGAAIGSFSYRVVLDGAPDGIYDDQFDDASAERPAKFLVPGGPFSLTVQAPGCAVVRREHVDPAACGDRIVVDLAALPTWRGVVRAPGAAGSAAAPVAGASVTLLRAAPERRSMSTNGFPLTRTTSPEARATTDAQGAFEVTVRDAGAFIVRAEAAGFAPGETAVVRLNSDGGALPAIDVTPGGALEGVVRTGGTRDPAGLIVGASRCDGAVKTATVGADGRYRFERLTPGPWIVKVIDRVTDDQFVVFAGAAPVEWSCEVRAGETTQHDIGIGAAAACVVRGRLSLPPGRKWWVGLSYPDCERGSTDDRSAVVAPDGTYEIGTERTGDFWLTVTTEGSDLRVYFPVKLARGACHVDAGFAAGTVEVGAPVSHAKANRTVVWTGDGGAFAMSGVVRGDDGRAVVSPVPAGKVRVVRYDPDGDAFDPRNWPVDAEIEVKEGRTTVVLLN